MAKNNGGKQPGFFTGLDTMPDGQGQATLAAQWPVSRFTNPVVPSQEPTPQIPVGANDSPEMQRALRELYNNPSPAVQQRKARKPRERKTSRLDVLVKPSLKKALLDLAEAQDRSMGDIVEEALLDYLQQP